MSSEPQPAPFVPRKRPCPHCGQPMIASTPAHPQALTEAELQLAALKRKPG